MMSNAALILALMIAVGNAGKFSVPISQERNEVVRDLISKRHESVGTQKPFKNEPPSRLPLIDIHGGDYREPSSTIERSGIWLYTTNLSLGTPPQSFRAVVDLNAMDLFVPSISCGGSHCSDNTKAKYDPSESSTFHENGTILRKFYIATMAYGIVNDDTLRLGKLEIPEQQFTELKYYEYVYPDKEALLYDSVLGLGYDGVMFELPGAPNVLASPFRSMVDQDLLDENMFGLQIPKDESSTGDLTFGGYNEDLVDDELVPHPLYPENTTYWQVQANSFAMTGKECGQDITLVNETLNNYTASLWTSYPGIMLPSLLAQKAFWKINYKRSSCTFQDIVDCDSLSSLPEIRFGFGDQEIVLKGEDYTMIYEDDNPASCGHPVKECWLMVQGAPDRSEDFPQDEILLGTSFLKSVYSVFDWDRKTVSLRIVKNDVTVHNGHVEQNMTWNPAESPDPAE